MKDKIVGYVFHCPSRGVDKYHGKNWLNQWVSLSESPELYTETQMRHHKELFPHLAWRWIPVYEP